MKKTKEVKSYTRKTKGGKTVTVKAHSASYDSAEDMAKNALKTKKGAGKELMTKKKTEEVPTNDYGISPEEFKAWYHWDYEDDPKNKTALAAESKLKKKMGARKYKKFFNDMTDSYSARGHNKSFKNLITPEKITTKIKIANKATQNKTNDSSDKTKIQKVKKEIKVKESKVTANDITKMFPEYSYDEKTNAFYRPGRGYSFPKPKAFKQMENEYRKLTALKNKSSDEHIKKLTPSSWSNNDNEKGINRSFYGTSAWGNPRHSGLEKVVDNFKHLGWKEASSSESSKPDDSGYERKKTYVSPDKKYKLEQIYRDGNYGSNSHEARISKL